MGILDHQPIHVQLRDRENRRISLLPRELIGLLPGPGQEEDLDPGQKPLTGVHHGQVFGSRGNAHLVQQPRELALPRRREYHDLAALGQGRAPHRVLEARLVRLPLPGGRAAGVHEPDHVELPRPEHLARRRRRLAKSKAIKQLKRIIAAGARQRHACRHLLRRCGEGL